MKRSILALLAIVCVSAHVASGDPAAADVDGIPHLQKQGTATQLIVDGKPLILLAGELHNSSSSSLEYMEPVWDRLKGMHLNAVIASASWELVEPKEGVFDFGLVDGLIEKARGKGFKLVLIWFGSWKNTHSSYAPVWVKTDMNRFFRAQRPTVQRSDVTTSISAFCDAARDADAKAFGALMRHLKQVDGQTHTVVAIQVENETGLLGFSRDHRPEAETAFVGAVPGKLMDYLQAHGKELAPELKRLWQSNGGKPAGAWEEVFGKGTGPAEIYGPADGADEPFMAWQVASYCNAVAAAGKKEYPLPMYVNAWLIQSEGQQPGKYPSGGPVSRMLDVWRAAAPSIDFIAPDIYLSDFKSIAASYTRGGNPLFIPEHVPSEDTAAKVFWAICQHDAICFAPFGIDDVAPDHPLSESYEFLSPLLPVIAKYQGTGEMVGLLQAPPYRGKPLGKAGAGIATPGIAAVPTEETEEIELGNYVIHVRYARNEPTKLPGCGFVINTGPDEFLVAGSRLIVEFHPKPGGPAHVEYLTEDEVHFNNGQWTTGRRLNGDEYAIHFLNEPEIRRVKLFNY